jgi:acetyl esterase/lipase
MILYVHGGQWSLGTRMNNQWIYEPLAASGLVVVAIDFRLAPQHPYPGPLADINYATRWLKAHAGDFNGDGERLGGLGCSSGGHQVMLSAMRPRDPRHVELALAEEPELDASLAYIVACWPILDPRARYLFAQETGREDIVTRTEGYFLTREAMEEGNPQLILDRSEPVELPPTLILQGTEDRNVTPAIQERFAASFRAAGGVCELEIFPGMPHGTTRWPETETERALRLMRDFVGRQLGGNS